MMGVNAVQSRRVNRAQRIFLLTYKKKVALLEAERENSPAVMAHCEPRLPLN